MQLLRSGNALALLFSYPAFITAQISTGTGGSSVISQSQAPFPVLVNSSSTTIVEPSTPITGSYSTTHSDLSSTTLPLATQKNDTVVNTITSTYSSAASTSSSHSLGSSSVSPIASSSTLSSVLSSAGTFQSGVSSATNLTTFSSSNTEAATSGATSLSPTAQPTAVSSASNTVSSILATSDSPSLPPGITITPSLPITTLVPTRTEVQSSASDLSIAIVGVFPIIQNWIEDPAAHITGVIDELNNILPEAAGFLAKLPKPTDGVEPCRSGKRRRSEPDRDTYAVLGERDLLGGLFKTAFSLVNCVINTTNKVKDAVVGGTTAAVDTVKGLQDDLKPLLDALNDVVPDGYSEASDSASDTEEPTETSSSTCTLTTVSNCDITCTATATTTIGRPNKRAQGDVCPTVCGEPITKCDVTGVTSSSTVTTTTTTARQLCARDCDSCNGNVRRLVNDAPAPTKLTTAFEDNALSSTSTIIASYFNKPELRTRELAPLETSQSTSHILKRTLSSPPQGSDKGMYSGSSLVSSFQYYLG